MSPELMRRQPTNPLRERARGGGAGDRELPQSSACQGFFVLNLTDCAAIALNEFHAVTSTGIAQFLIIKSTHIHIQHICIHMYVILLIALPLVELSAE